MPYSPRHIPRIGAQRRNRYKDLTPKDRGCNPDHKGYMLNPRGEKLLCMWADCEHPGLNKLHLDILRGAGGHSEIEHFIFCSPLHRALFINSHERMGYVRPGDTS
jgi:hypothetical protein